MSLRDAARNVAADALGDSPHPEPDALIEYALGALDDDAAETVRWHVSLCQTCADVVLDAARFPDELPAEPLDDDQLDAHWTQFRSERGAEAFEPTNAERETSLSTWRATPPPMRFAMAALLVMTMGLGTLLGMMLLRESDSPRTRFAVARLAIESTRGDETAARIVVAADTEVVLLTITSPGVGVAESYGVEIFEDDPERSVWRWEGLRPEEAGYLLVALPPGFLAPGSYDLELSRRGNVLGRAGLEIVSAPRGDE